MTDPTLLAVPRHRAAELTGVSLRQLDYWDRTGLVRPAAAGMVSPRRRVRLYGFADLLSLLVIGELRRRRVSLQHIRGIVTRLRERGYPAPLTQFGYATVGADLYLQFDDGVWEFGRRPDQTVIVDVLDLEPLRNRVREAGRRDPGTAGRIERRRGALGAKPLIAGTRVPVGTVRRYLDRGASVDQVIAAYPVLERADVEAVRNLSA